MVYLPFLRSSAAFACVWSSAIESRNLLMSASEIPAPGASELDAVTRSSMLAKGQRKKAWSTKPRNAGLRRGTSRCVPSSSNLYKERESHQPTQSKNNSKLSNFPYYAEIIELRKTNISSPTLRSVPSVRRPEPFCCPQIVLCPGGVSRQQPSHCP